MSIVAWDNSRCLCLSTKKLSDMSRREKPPVGAILLNPLTARRISTDSSVDNIPSTDIKQSCVSDNQNRFDDPKEECVMFTDEESNSFLSINSKVVNTLVPDSLGISEPCAASKIQSGHHSDQVAKDYCEFPESKSSPGNVAKAESSLSLLTEHKQGTQTFIGSSQIRKKKKTVLPQGLLDNVTDRVKQQRDVLTRTKPEESYKKEKEKKTAVATRISTTFPGNMGVQPINSESLDTSTCYSEEITQVTFDYEEVVRKHCNFQDIIDKEQLPATCTEKGRSHVNGNIGNSEVKEFVDESVDVLVVETSVYNTSKYETGSEAKHITEVTETSIDSEVTEGPGSEFELLSPHLVAEGGQDVGHKVEEVYDLSSLSTGELDKRYKSEKKKANKRKGNKLKSKIKNQKGSISERGEEMAAQRWKKNQFPNYFISIQITNKQIHDALCKVQEEVLDGNQLLSPAMIKLAKLHITLMILRLENKEEISRAKRALENIKDKLLSQYSNKTIQLHLCGIGNFRDEVVFAKIKGEEQVQKLEDIANIVKECFLNEELEFPDEHGFNPHITLMKMSQAKHLREKGIRKIDEKLYEKFRDTDFGVEEATTIQLCAMRTTSSGYYHIEHEVQFMSGK